jgi:hypothetical protein
LKRIDAATWRQVLKAMPNDPVLVQVCDLHIIPDLKIGLRTVATALFFNTGEQSVQRTYPLALLGLDGPLYVFDWTANRSWPNRVDMLPVALAPHDSALLFLSPEPIKSAPEKLT